MIKQNKLHIQNSFSNFQLLLRKLWKRILTIMKFLTRENLPLKRIRRIT